MKQENLGIFTPIMIALATITILALVTFQIISKAKARETTGSAAYNAIEELEEANSDTIGWVGIVITAVVGFAVIGIFAFRQR